MYSYEYQRIVNPRYSLEASRVPGSFWMDDAIMKDDSYCSKPVDHLRVRGGEGQRRNVSKSKRERERGKKERGRDIVYPKI